MQQQELLESSISLPDLLKLFLSHWRWFLFSLVIFLSLGMLYLSITQPVYTRSTSILIKEDKENSASTGDLSAFQNLGLFQGSSKVQNELITIQSPVIITEVVRRLGLNVNYSVRTGLRSHTLYGTELPLRLQLLDHDLEEGISLVLSPSTDGGSVRLRRREAPAGSHQGALWRYHQKPYWSPLDPPRAGRLRSAPSGGQGLDLSYR